MPSHLPNDLPAHHDAALPPARRVAAARDEVVHRLVARGLDAQAAAEITDRHAGRLVAPAVGPVRVQDPTGAGFYPLEPDDPLRHLVAELWAGAPGSAKAGYVPPSGPHAYDHRPPQPSATPRRRRYDL